MLPLMKYKLFTSLEINVIFIPKISLSSIFAEFINICKLCTATYRTLLSLAVLHCLQLNKIFKNNSVNPGAASESESGSRLYSVVCL